MTTKEKIATHTKAIEILELLERAEKRLVEAQEDLYNYRNASKAEQLRSIYCGAEYEFKVKKGERSVSFINGMYERYINKMFANSWETTGYTVTTLPFELIDLPEDFNLNREHKEILHFPMNIKVSDDFNKMRYTPLPDGYRTIVDRPFEVPLPYNIHPDD